MQSHDDCHSATSVYVLKRVFATVRSTYVQMHIQNESQQAQTFVLAYVNSHVQSASHALIL